MGKGRKGSERPDQLTFPYLTVQTAIIDRSLHEQ
jgi:hypothetical protein